MMSSEPASSNGKSDVSISRVIVEHLREPLGIGTARPRLSWMVETNKAGWKQAAYEIEVLDADGNARGETGRVESDESVLADWALKPLASRERVTVRVRVWGEDGKASAWSKPVAIEAGLLEEGDWSAQFVGPDWDEDTSRAQPAPLLRQEFEVREEVQQARLYITSLGVHEAYLNGEVIGDHVMDPGWTTYHHRLRYQTFDVTKLLKRGRNALGAMLGDGWFRGRLGFGGGQRNIYGERLALLAQLEITYAGGTTERVVTDENWPRSGRTNSRKRYL